VAADRGRLTADILVAGAGPAGLALALQAHDRDADQFENLAPARYVTVHRLTSVPGHGVTVVRPDGYIGFRGRAAEAGQVVAWLALVSAGLCR
jgi:hypothetical protein